MRSLPALAAVACIAAVVALVAPPAAATGPGLGNRAWSADQVMQPVGFIQSPDGHGNVALVQGYLMVIYSSDGGGDVDDGGIEFWDVADPTAPVRVIAYDDDDTHGLREAHGFTLAWFQDGLDGLLVLCAQGEEGVQFWDVTDPLDIALLSDLDLPGITKGDYSGGWWTFFQAPFVYVAGVDSGISVVDATDLRAPVLVAQVPTGALAGVSPAQVFATGDLLVVMEAQGRGYATLDIADPRAPRLLRHLEGNAGYSNIFAGPGLILTSGNIPPRVSVHQVSPTGGMEHVSTFGFVLNSGGYGTWQDGIFHTGFSDRYVKADIAAEEFVGDGTSGRADRDEDFATVLGNLVFAGNDHGNGSALIAHQQAPDTRAPVVEWMHPPAGSATLALTSRIGLSFSDHIDASSLNAESIVLADEDGVRVPLVLSAQLGLVNLAPKNGLSPSTTYRLVVEGVRDVAGNPSPRFEADVTTGAGAPVRDPATLITDLDTRSLIGDSTLAVFRAGVSTYVDRDFAFLPGYPPRLEAQALLQTRNNDKFSVALDFITFTLTRPADVHVLYDARASSVPDWLSSSFTRTGERVDNDDAGYNVWQKSFPAGALRLGGNNADGANGADSMYSVVVVVPPLSCSLALAPAVAGTVALHVDGPAGARYDWQIGETNVDDAGADVATALPSGRHGVVVTATFDGERATCSAVQIVHGPVSAESASSSEPIVWSRSRGAPHRVIVANVDNGTVTAVDPETGSTVWETATGPAPVAVAINSSFNYAHVLDRDDATVTILDGDGNAFVAARLPRASRPAGIVVDGENNSWVTLSATGEVVKLAPDGTVVARAFVTPTAAGLAQHGDRLYVSRFLSPDTHGEIVVVDAVTLATIATITLPFDAGPDTEASGRGVPSQLSSLRISADGTRGYVSGTKANTARGLFRDGLPLTFESRTRAFVATIDLAQNVEMVSLRLDVNDRDGVQGMALSPTGDVVFVAARGANVVDVFDVLTGRRVSQFAVGKAPVGLAFDASGTRLAVSNLLSRSVSLFDATELVSGRDNHIGAGVVVGVVGVDRLSPEVLRGKQVFFDASDRRMSKDSYISCASCHPDGGHDGRTWDFTQAGEGLRNTISLEGRAGLGHGNVHWTANFDEVQDFENDIRSGFGGTGFLSDADFAATSDPLGAPKAGRSADLDALAAYVATFDRAPPSPFRDDDGAMTASARRGRVIFQSVGCTECHGGAAFSDFARHDVGTVGAGSGTGLGVDLAGAGFETPTLRGIWDTAPYLHDGSAPTLRDAVRRHVDDSGVTDDARDDLVAYLLALDDAALAPEAPCDDGDECVVADSGEGEGEGEAAEGEGETGDGEGEGEGEGEGTGDVVADGCGCSSRVNGGVDVGLVSLLAALLARRRRRR